MQPRLSIRIHIEPESHRNIEVVWRLRHLKSDPNTIADFSCENWPAWQPPSPSSCCCASHGYMGWQTGCSSCSIFNLSVDSSELTSKT